MQPENAADAALKLANLILEEHEQYGTLKSLVPLAESVLGSRQPHAIPEREYSVLQN